MISVIGLGFVGGSMKKSFELKGESVKGYDKFKENTDSFEDCLESDIAFLALPTIFDENKMTYDKSAIHEVCGDLEKHQYNGLVVIKSTVEPTTTEGLALKYSTLKFIHNPEFLTAATAFEDFHNQKHIVLGKSINVHDDQVDVLETFYKKNYPDAEISRCTCTESESMKSFVNCFYSVKIQFFNELYLLCQKMGCDYNNVKELMLKNGWINPMHTDVPGVDGMLSYGGYCFPKDTNALLNHMKRENVTCKVLEGTVLERNEMRKDNVNVKLKGEDDVEEGFDEIEKNKIM
jgi:UDPglucose 6-dehydrogenase